MPDLDDALRTYDETISTLRGQLHEATAYATIFLLNRQSELGMTGNLLEIGVLGGRYLALMSRHTGPGEKAFGIDPFYLEGTSGEKVMADLAAIGCDDTAEVITARSDKFSHAEYIERFGKARFFHIDGSHQRDDVIKDLAIAEAVLAEEGVLSFDDFLNPYWMGVTEALFVYLERNPESDLVPFAHCRNKLFLCRADHVATWDAAFADFIAALGGRLPISGKTDRTTSVCGRTIPVLH